MPVQEVKVEYNNPELDTRGKGVAAEAARALGIEGLKVSTADLYFLESSARGARRLARNLLTEPVTQHHHLNPKWSINPKVIRIGYQAGVMDPVSQELLQAAADLGVNLESARTGVEYRFKGEISPDQVQTITSQLLMNPIVQTPLKKRPDILTVEVKPPEDWQLASTTVVALKDGDDNWLSNLASDFGFSDVEEVKALQKFFQEHPELPATTDALRAVAVWWSEHCGHKTFRRPIEVNGRIEKPLFTRIKEASRPYFDEREVLSAFEDNSGVIRFYDGWALNIKGETHNFPSAVEPFSGAGTGVGGILRDIYDTAQGARVIFLGDIFCFADPQTPLSEVPRGCLPPDYIQRRVVDGVADYGNKFGVPTANGSIHYHQDFRAKPTVMIIAAGLLPESKSKKGRGEPGDLLLVIGGKTGKDGVGGATFSSVVMTDRTATVHSQAVQIGNPIEEKRVADATLELMANDLVVARNDFGAGGPTSAMGELAKHTGATINLDRFPLKYQGLEPWEILVGESQERSAIVVKPENLEQILAVCNRHDVEATVVGHLNDSEHFNVFYKNTQTVKLPYQFLENGLPDKTLRANWIKPEFDSTEPPTPTDWVDTFKKILSHGNVCSKQPVVNRYDHGVQGTSALPPFGGKNFDSPNDAAVLTPILGKNYATIFAHGMNPILNRIDPYWGTLWACTESASNYIAAGGDPETMVFCENFVSPVPNEQYLGSLDQQVRAIVDFIHLTHSPVISGKDSLSSTYQDYDDRSKPAIEIPPVVTITTMGKVANVEQTASADFKKPFSVVCLVSRLSPDMGGSTFYDINGLVGNQVPKVDFQRLPQIFSAVHQGIKCGRVRACHDVSEGGVASALAEMCFGGDCGVEIDINLDGEKAETFLFNETAGCFIVEVEDEETAERLFRDVPFTILGRTTPQKDLSISLSGEHLFTAKIDELKQSWKSPLEEIFH